MAPTRAPSRQSWRYLYRVPLLVVHVLIVLPLALIAFLPGLRDLPGGQGQSLQTRAHRFWCAGLLGILGVRLNRSGQELPRGPAMIVANHISWMDILVIHALDPARFVAKAEIRRWPLVGVLAAIAGTVFIQRGSSNSRQRVTRRIGACLRRGEKVAVFPEGGINPHPGVGRFHARLMAAAVRTGAPVVPVAIKYARDEDLHDQVVFAPGRNFLLNVLDIMAQPPFFAYLRIAESIPSVAARRDVLARNANNEVSRMYEY